MHRQRRVMRGWQRLLFAIVAIVVVGFVVPAGVIAALLLHYNPPYTVDERRLQSPRDAFGGAPAAVRFSSGPYPLSPGWTAFYPDGGTVRIIRSVNPAHEIEAYAAVLDPPSSSSWSIGNYTQRDVRLRNGFVERFYGIRTTLFVFAARSFAAIDRLVAQTPSLRRVSQNAIGNAVFDRHRTAAVIGFGLWFIAAVVAIAIVVVRTPVVPPVLPASGTPVVPREELVRRLLALNGASHPFVVTAGTDPDEIFIDWRYADAGWNELFAAGKVSKLFRIRLRLQPQIHTVDSTDFESEYDIAGGATPNPFAATSWHASRGYVFVQREAGLAGTQSYSFDVQRMRGPVVATVSGAGWIYRPRM